MRYRDEALWREIQAKSVEIRRRRRQELAAEGRVSPFDLAYYWLALALAVCVLVWAF